MNRQQALVKRTFDCVAAFVGIIVFIPFFILISMVVALTSKGPVFFYQKRIGRYGRPFTCIKFRTMYIGADRHGSITTATDSRITPIGKILRSWKLDEFPQLWNVLLGRMSFVGPRPDVEGYADTLTGTDRRVLELRPGITGPATIFFRYEEELLAQVDKPVTFNDAVIWPFKVQLNTRYFDSWSFMNDLLYILGTLIPPVIFLAGLIPKPPRSVAEFLKLKDTVSW